MSVVFEDELFEVQEGAFVGDFLPDLNEGFPSMFGVGFCAVRTLLICHNEFAFECLLEDGRSESFFLNGEFHSDST